MTKLSAHLRGIGVIGPGIADWPALRSVFAGRTTLSGDATVIPVLNVLPATERRRVGSAVKLALGTGLQACAAGGADPSDLPTVFASSSGDGSNCHAICETLASDDRLISPTRFHNSVSNAASGYWSIATGAQTPSAIIAAYDGTFAAGLLEAVVQLASEGGRVLLVSHDSPYPAPLDRPRPMRGAMGIGLLLDGEESEGQLARLELSLSDASPTVLADDRLEALRTGNPTGRGLLVLDCAARIEGGARAAGCVLEYLGDLQLAVHLEAPR